MKIQYIVRTYTIYVYNQYKRILYTHVGSILTLHYTCIMPLGTLLIYLMHMLDLHCENVHMHAYKAKPAKISDI